MSSLSLILERIRPDVASSRRSAGAADLLRRYGIVLVLAVLVIALSVASPDFVSGQNFANILDQWFPIGIMAVGMTVVLIAGGFDLSIGAVFALAGVVSAKFALDGHVVLGCVAGITVGVLAGAVNGLVATVGRINAFIATLATSIIIRGIAVALTGGFVVSVTSDRFTWAGNTQFLGLSLPVWVMFATAAVCGFVLAFTVFGRRVYAVGSNPEAARLAGVRIHLTRQVAYMFAGGTAGLAGVLSASRVASGQSNVGESLVFQVFTVAVVGGTSIFGGVGAVWRTLIGLLVLAFIGNGLNLLNVDPLYQYPVQGLIILLAVAVDAWTSPRVTT